MSTTAGRWMEQPLPPGVAAAPFGAVDGVSWDPGGYRRLVGNEELERIRPLIPSVAASLGPGLQRVAPDAPLERAFAALWRDGAVIIERAVSEECCDRVVEEMEPYLAEQGFGRNEFSGSATKRLGGVVGRAPSSCEIVAHPLLIKLCEGILGRQMLSMAAEELLDTFPKDVEDGSVPASDRTPPDANAAEVFHPYQTHVHQIIHIAPGSAAQPIHRDGDFMGFEFGQKLTVDMSTIWALSPFTEDVGPTRIVPGSHRWTDMTRAPDLSPESEEWEPATMPKGSVVVILGRTLHSGGENRTKDVSRWALGVDYCPAWMRQEVNQYLDVPPLVANRLPKPVQQLIGYAMGGETLGYVDGGTAPSPEEHLDPNINWATPDSAYERAFGKAAAKL